MYFQKGGVMVKGYKLEVWLTAICFTIVFIFGCALSALYIIGIDVFFVEVDGLYQAVNYVWGFPLHYFLLIVLSWLGATVIGIIWVMVMDKLERDEVIMENESSFCSPADSVSKTGEVSSKPEERKEG